MSIDFQVKKQPNTVEKFFYKLFVGGENYKDIQFHDAIYTSSIELVDGSVYEFGYNNQTKKFILFRPRPDKKHPNFYKVAENVWNDMINPFTKEQLLQLLNGISISPAPIEDSLKLYRKYHNTIKNNLITTYCNKKTILDLGAGQGGDLPKYLKSDIKYLWAVEPDEQNYNEYINTYFNIIINL